VNPYQTDADRVVVLVHIDRALWQRVMAASVRSARSTSQHVTDALTEYFADRTYDDARTHPRPCRCGKLVTRPEQCDGPPCPFEKHR
jgi:hypothetical protein